MQRAKSLPTFTDTDSRVAVDLKGVSRVFQNFCSHQQTLLEALLNFSKATRHKSKTWQPDASPQKAPSSNVFQRLLGLITLIYDVR